MNRVYYLNFVVWVVLANLFSILLVEGRYQKDVIPSIAEDYNYRFSLLKVELQRKEPEKTLCYSKTEIIELLKNGTGGGV